MYHRVWVDIPGKFRCLTWKGFVLRLDNICPAAGLGVIRERLSCRECPHELERRPIRGVSRKPREIRSIGKDLML